MGWLIFIGVVILLLGPLRPWMGRHWTFLLSVVLGGAFGWFMGAFAVGVSGARIPFLPLLWAAVAAIAVGRAGPAWLRKIQKDGRD